MQLDSLDQTFCGDVSSATDSYIYGYTSYENLTKINMFTEQIEPFINRSDSCVQFTIYYFCNYIYVPCDLTTGGPLLTCSNSCYFLRTNCPIRYFQVLSFGASAGYPIVDNCENTLSYLQQEFGFPCSSSSLQNDCIDYLGM